MTGPIPAPLTRRAALGAGIAALAAPGHARAQAFPSRPVSIVVGFPPGGQTDFAARIVQNGMAANLGQPVVIDNRPGAGGNLGTEFVLRARPDGHTLLAGNSAPMTINPHTYASMTINPLDLAPVGMALTSSLILCVHPSVPARNLTELTAYIRAQPRGVDYGTGSAGSLTHCAMELLRQRIGNPAMEVIPYRGSGPAMQDLIAGRIPMLFDGASVLAPFIRANQVRPILVTGAQRAAAFPDVPTATEQGLENFSFVAWIGLYAPRGTPPEVIARLNTAMNAALQDPTVRERITSQGDEPGGGTPEQLGEITRRDHALWAQVVRAANIRAE